MEITRKILRNIMGKHNGFARLDTICTELGMTINPPNENGIYDNVTAVNLWTVRDKLVSTILPAIKADVLEGEENVGFVLVSHRRRGQHGLKDTQFPQAIMPDKPTELMKKVRKAKDEDDEEEKSDVYIPGIVSVDMSWYTKDEDKKALTADVAELFRNIDFKAGGPSLAFMATTPGKEKETGFVLVSAKRDDNGGGTYVTLLLRNVK